jgi:hypothetical protein
MFVHKDSIIGRLASSEARFKALFELESVAKFGERITYWDEPISDKQWFAVYRRLKGIKWESPPDDFHARVTVRESFWLDSPHIPLKTNRDKAAKALFEKTVAVVVETRALVTDFIAIMREGDDDAAVMLVVQAEIEIPRLRQDVLGQDNPDYPEANEIRAALLDALSKLEGCLDDLRGLFDELDRASSSPSMASFSAKLATARLAVKLGAIDLTLGEAERKGALLLGQL